MFRSQLNSLASFTIQEIQRFAQVVQVHFLDGQFVRERRNVTNSLGFHASKSTSHATGQGSSGEFGSLTGILQVLSTIVLLKLLKTSQSLFLNVTKDVDELLLIAVVVFTSNAPALFRWLGIALEALFAC